ncbi:MAG: FKBP-type peptidyl-prolyl cis-trans isomerase [Candidatus Wildermuthbacteria bacterium]|nr:FKBP-type peptidyl-prolyl cis-trans isomerase [Candidatus Wildermuthbacteria bacterium]
MRKIILIIILILIGGVSIWQFSSKKDESDEIIGGQKDEHGCLIAAGYSWCQPKQKCLKIWEEGCLENATSGNAQNQMDKNELAVETLKQGTGSAAKNGDKITVNYTGTLEDGTQFDSSIGRGPFSFTLGVGQVIKGWDAGVLGMKIGEKRKLTIPSDMAYGAAGAGGLIPPNAVLIFEVELLGIN